MRLPSPDKWTLETEAEMKLARKAFVDSFTDNSGFRPGIETIGWLYGEAAKRIFEQPNLKQNLTPVT